MSCPEITPQPTELERLHDPLSHYGWFADDVTYYEALNAAARSAQQWAERAPGEPEVRYTVEQLMTPSNARGIMHGQATEER